jgi:hypothetical protein
LFEQAGGRWSRFDAQLAGQQPAAATVLRKRRAVPPGMTGVGKVEASPMKRISLPIGTSIPCIAERKSP